MNRHRTRQAPQIWTLAACTWMFGCHQPATDADPTTRAANHNVGVQNAASRWVEVQRPSDRALLQFPAQAVASPKSTARVSLSHVGVLRRLDIMPGDRLEAGDVVAHVSVPELAVTAAALDAETAELVATKTRLAELETLVRRQLVSRSDVFEIEARKLALQARVARASAELASAQLDPRDRRRLLGEGLFVVRAPAAGTVVEVSAMVGDRVGGDAGAIATLRSDASPRVEALMPREVPPAGSASFVAIDGATYELRMPTTAGVVALDDGRRRQWFEIVSSAADRPPAGLRGRVVLSELPDDVREIPVSSLAFVQGVPSVIAEDVRGTRTRRTVEVITSSQSVAWVRGPLELEDRVSTDPAEVLPSPTQESAHHGH